jgi:hypothetical protein
MDDVFTSESEFPTQRRSVIERLQLTAHILSPAFAGPVIQGDVGIRNHCP